MSKRDYLVNYLGKKPVPPSGIGGGNTAGPGTGGGSGTTAAHALDGPQHTDASTTDLLLATLDHVGLMPPLSGDSSDALLGDGTWGALSATVAEIADLPTAETDTSLVLSPDGGGGVEWRAETSGLPWFNVMDPAYGAANDGSTDDTSAINAAIAAWNSAGYGVLYFPGGTGYKVSSALTTITAGGRIVGDGRGAWSETSHAPAGYGSKINFTSATAVLFTITAAGGSISDIALVNTAGSPASAGSAILANSSDFHGKFDLRNVLMGCWYVGYDCKVNGGTDVDNVGIFNPQSIGIRVRNTVHTDSGGAMFKQVVIQDDGSAHSGVVGIQIETSGGNKIIGCNIQTVETPIKLIAGADSSILIIDGCSIESYSGNAINLDANGHSYAFIHVDNTHFGQYSNSTGHAVNAVDVDSLTIEGYDLRADTGTPTAFVTSGATRVFVGNGTNRGFTTPLLSASGGSAIVDGTGAVAAGVNITGTPSSGQVPIASSGTAAAWGTPTAAPSFATPSIALGSSAAAGAASTVIRSDSTIAAFDATAPTTQAFSDSAATGSAAFAARRDHKHGMPASPASGSQLLIADTHSTPLIFADLIQTEAQDDLLYAD